MFKKALVALILSRYFEINAACYESSVPSTARMV